MPLRIADGVEISDDELTFTASKSGGPGGQHVNKTSSRVTVRFDVRHSPTLSGDVRERLLSALGRRVAADGTVRVVCQSSRSQFANRKRAVERLVGLLQEALTPVAPRVATRVPVAERRKRTDAKRHRAAVKRDRGPVDLG